MKSIAIRCEGITKRYGQKWALNNLSIEIPAHQVTGILGPNGAGKSTLFQLMTGLTHPDEGEITILDKQPGWRTNTHIAYLSDRARWYQEHTVEKAFNWAEDLLPGFDRKRADHLANFMDLDLSSRVSGMSKGQEARLMLILCVARNVPLIILDEPFSGIDLISRDHIISALIDNIAEQKQTLIISTHEIGEAESLFDHVIFLQDGEAILAENAEHLRSKKGSIEKVYRNTYQGGNNNA